MQRPYNPFLTKGYISPRYFCDRQKETKTILEALTNGRNITLYGRRKLGKTALIKNVFYNMDNSHICIWIDLLPAQNFAEMVNIMTNNIYSAFHNNKSLSKKFLEYVKVLRPVISYDDLTGTPQITLDTSDKKLVRKNFEELLRLLKLFKKPVIIAMDEFQQILKFPEKDTEGYLRTIIQEMPDLNFIFSGSDQHLLHQMFTGYSKPFYQMSQIMKLGVINSEIYSEFILHHFKKASKKIETDDIKYILEWAKGITYYVQVICNRVFAQETKKINRNLINTVLNNILSEFEDSYYTFREMITPIQWKLLKAIAREGKVSHIYSKQFMKRHNFYNASSLKKSLGSLIKDQLIYKSTNQGVAQYEIQDVFFSKWLARL